MNDQPTDKSQPERRGRPSFQATRLYITLTKDQIEWLKSRGNASEQIRNLIDQEMKKEKK